MELEVLAALLAVAPPAADHSGRASDVLRGDESAVELAAELMLVVA